MNSSSERMGPPLFSNKSLIVVKLFHFMIFVRIDSFFCLFRSLKIRMFL